MASRVILKVGVGDHPPERLARHEMDELWRIVKTRQRYNVVANMMQDALRVAAMVGKTIND